jgi:hypothetical protein
MLNQDERDALSSGYPFCLVGRPDGQGGGRRTESAKQSQIAGSRHQGTGQSVKNKAKSALGARSVPVRAFWKTPYGVATNLKKQSQRAGSGERTCETKPIWARAIGGLSLVGTEGYGIRMQVLAVEKRSQFASGGRRRPQEPPPRAGMPHVAQPPSAGFHHAKEQSQIRGDTAGIRVVGSGHQPYANGPLSRVKLVKGIERDRG